MGAAWFRRKPKDDAARRHVVGDSCFGGVVFRLPSFGSATSSSAGAELLWDDGKDPLRNLREPWVNPAAKALRCVRTLAVGARVHYASKRLEWQLAKLPDLDEEDLRDRWDTVHRANAEKVLQHIYRYRGFFSKLGQSLSAKKGSLPEPWVETLTPLQDDMPSSHFAAVRQVIEKELGKALSVLFSDITETPVASASVAQAHVAHLAGTGEKVCIKVQHPGVAELMGTDLNTLQLLFWLMKKLHKDAPDLTAIAKEWQRTSHEEVDFCLEAQNAADACAALRRRGLKASSCEPLSELCSKRVLTMHFVEGWKITEIEKFPAGADLEAVGCQLWEAFAMLALEEGLIHGDPHPGNIFVEAAGPDSKDLRPVFLDWGIVKRMSESERVALAKWVVASLSADRNLYLCALKELGFEMSADIDYAQLDQIMKSGMLLLRDTLPSSSMQQFVRQRDELERRERTSARKKAQQFGSAPKPAAITKISGTILYFFRGAQLLHDCCGMLDVMVPVARLMLKYSLPLLETTSSGNARRQPAMARRSALEAAVLAKLEELRVQGNLVGAQVAVSRARQGLCEFECDVAFGKKGLVAGSLSEDSLMPLLDVGTVVLVKCLLLGFSRPTATGKHVGLDSEVSQLWPEFSQRGKAGVTVRELLQHQANLCRPFSRKLNYKNICNERKIEETIAACVSETCVGACKVLGAAAAALLRRALGRKNAADALQAILKPLGLEEDIVYSGPDERMAYLGHRLLEEVSMASMWEMLEERQRRDDSSGGKGKAWLSWQEFAQEQPWCTDALLINREDLRSGSACATGRGLRASARAICRLLMADVVQEDILAESCVAREPCLEVASLDEWEDLGRCLDVGSGWQLLKFRKIDGSGELTAYGHLDGTTGSCALRLPELSISVLLSGVDPSMRKGGQELLATVATHLGLEPMWQEDVPTVPEHAPVFADDLEEGDRYAELAASLRRVEEKLAGLTADQAGTTLKAPGDEASSSRSPLLGSLSGRWISSDMLGLDQVLEALNVPAIARGLAKHAKRSLEIKEHGSHLSIKSAMTLARRDMEEKELNFEVGEPFRGQSAMFGSFQGLARWLNDGSTRELLVTKKFRVQGTDATLEETYKVTPSGNLSVTLCMCGRGQVVVELTNDADRDALCRALDCKSLQLKKEAKLVSGTLLRGGRLIGPEALSSFAQLTLAQTPTTLQFNFKDVQCTTLFEPQRGQQPSAASSTAASIPRPGRTSSTAYKPSSVAGNSSCSSVMMRSDNEGPGACLEGPAWKKSRHLKQWRRRWLVLTTDDLRSLGEDQVPTETIRLRDLRALQVADESQRRDACLRLAATRRTYFFSFNNTEVRDKWMQELSRISGVPCCQATQANSFASWSWRSRGSAHGSRENASVGATLR
eukprot:TRINITY_DN28849_c0_g1_i1.p1 TRINITY_DN28849_c0_g1~~TRINITY_DN28849_c0_g1_i1.p1  ORF type:complete len:1393 (-),score=249.84 TRINITY_DN28849_c0_g1_i1:86-4264(-)